MTEVLQEGKDHMWIFHLYRVDVRAHPRRTNVYTFVDDFFHLLVAVSSTVKLRNSTSYRIT